MNTPRIQKPAKHPDRSKKNVVAAHFFDTPAQAIEKSFSSVRTSTPSVTRPFVK